MPVGTRLNPRRSTIRRSTSIGDICLITKDSLEVIIRENAENRKLHMESLQNMEKSLDRISQCMIIMNEHATTSANSLCQKLDGLIEAISQNNKAATKPPPCRIDETLKHRKTLVEKMVRHELLSKYYDELLNEENPFARKALRTKVNRNASEIDLRHRRQQTIDNVRREILIMQDRLVEFGKRKQELEEKIKNFLRENEESRPKIDSTISRDDREARSNYEKKISFMKKTDEIEKKSLTSYLLKIQGDKPKLLSHSIDQKNHSHQSRPRYPKSPWKKGESKL